MNKKKTIVIVVGIIFLITIMIVLRSIYINNPKNIFQKYATSLNLESDYEIKESIHNTGWFGEKTIYYLIEYKPATMIKQINNFHNNILCQKIDSHEETSFKDLFQNDFKDIKIYTEILSHDYNIFYKLNDVSNDAEFYIFVTNENLMAIFITVG